MVELQQDEIMFFQKKAGALPLYLHFREKLPEIGEVDIQVKKSQISLIRRHIFGAVSFTPVRRAKDRPRDYFTLTFGLDHRLDSPRIDAALEAYPGRWTHHILIAGRDALDAEVFAWLREAAAFAAAK